MVWPTSCCIIEARLLHLEDEEHRHAHQLHEVAIDPSVVSEFISGSHRISVGLMTTKNRLVRININSEKGIVDSIAATAQMRRLSRSGFLA